MAFRRSGSFKRRYGSSRFRSKRRPLGRTITRPHLEMGTFFIEDELSLANSSAAETLEYFHLASIATSLASITSGGSSPIGTVLAAMQRRLIIHGVVIDYGWQMQGAIDGETGGLVQDGHVHCISGLLVDRQTTVDGSGVPFPASVATWSPWLSTFPTSTLQSAAPATTTDQVNQPQRVLMRKVHLMSCLPRIITGETVALFVPDEQKLHQNFPTINRRLRLSLDDEQGLYFYMGTRNAPTFDVTSAASRSIKRWLAGTIYYRFQQ